MIGCSGNVSDTWSVRVDPPSVPQNAGIPPRRWCWIELELSERAHD
jgi:hypothetical protein